MIDTLKTVADTFAKSHNIAGPHGRQWLDNDPFLVVACICVTLILLAVITGNFLLKWQKTRISAEENLKQAEFDRQMKMEEYYQKQRAHPSPYEKRTKEYERLSSIIDKYWEKDEKIRKEVSEENRETVKNYIKGSMEFFIGQLMDKIEEMKASE